VTVEGSEAVRTPGGDTLRRYLIVANQTLGGDELEKAADARVAAGPCEFWVVVPATRISELAPVTFIPMLGGVPVPVSDSPEESVALAQARLEAALERLRKCGAVADGEVGDPDPMQAVELALKGRHVDEILVSTLPARLSRWLHQDLPGRLERKFHITVTHIGAAPDE
jgi:hypothetical protein